MDKSISDLEGWKWRNEIPTRQTHSGIECRYYELHNKPISQLDLADVRFLIGQNSALEYLVPIAINALKQEIFLETEYYEGDLLCALMLINDEPNYWITHSKEKQELIALYTEQKSKLGLIDVSNDIRQKIKDAYSEFLKKNRQIGLSPTFETALYYNKVFSFMHGKELLLHHTALIALLYQSSVYPLRDNYVAAHAQHAVAIIQVKAHSLQVETLSKQYS